MEEGPFGEGFDWRTFCHFNVQQARLQIPRSGRIHPSTVFIGRKYLSEWGIQRIFLCLRIRGALCAMLFPFYLRWSQQVNRSPKHLVASVPSSSKFFLTSSQFGPWGAILSVVWPFPTSFYLRRSQQVNRSSISLLFFSWKVPNWRP